MKRIIYLFVLICCFDSLFSQNYTSIFGRDTTTWNIFEEGVDFSGTTVIFKAYNDTLINTKFYKCLYRYENDAELIAFLREDTVAGKVWFLYKYAYPLDTLEILIMDLGLSINDTFPEVDLVHKGISDIDTFFIKVIDIDTIMESKYIYFDVPFSHPHYEERLLFIEGVGPDRGILPYEYIQMRYLLCSYKDGIQVYQHNSWYFRGLCYYDEVMSLEEFKNNMSLFFPNPLSSIGKLHFNNPKYSPHFLSIYSVSGKLLFTFTTYTDIFLIDADDFRNGIYLYYIFNEESMISKGKFIVNTY